MFQEQQLIGDRAGFPLLDEPLLQLERVSVGDDSEPADFDCARQRSPIYIQASSKFSSRSLTNARKRPGIGAVDEPVVVAERDVAHRPDRNRIVDHDRALLDRADAEDRDLRLIDQRQPVQRAKDPGVGDGERARPALRRDSASSLRARVARSSIARLRPSRFFSSAFLMTGHDKPIVERDRDAEVDVLLVDDVVAVDRGIDDRELAQRVDRRPWR